MLDGWSACRDGVSGEDVSSGEVKGGDVMGSEVKGGDVMGGDVMGGDVMGEVADCLEDCKGDEVSVRSNLPEVGGCSGGEREEDAAKCPGARFSWIFLRRSLNEPITTACDLTAPLLDGEEEAASDTPADTTLVFWEIS